MKKSSLSKGHSAGKMGMRAEIVEAMRGLFEVGIVTEQKLARTIRAMSDERPSLGQVPKRAGLPGCRQ